jgi:hypothetical protein
VTNFATVLKQFSSVSPEQEAIAGKAIAGAMDDDVEAFMKQILELLEQKRLDPWDPQTFLKHEVYDSLPQEWKDHTDLALLNIADLLRLIVEFRVSKKTPDSSPQLQTMIKQLWAMKQRIEAHGHDVFIF